MRPWTNREWRVRRVATIGAIVGSIAGALFGLAVVSFADCAGSNCSAERVVGVAGHAAGGAASGLLLGLLLAGIARLFRRR